MSRIWATALSAPAVCVVAAPVAAGAVQSDETRPAYPETRRDNVVEDHFGQKVADPYRWLETDVRESKEVAGWVDAQSNLTRAYLDTLPGRDLFKARLTQLFDHEKLSVPMKRGGRYFYRRNSGLQNQAVLYMRESLNGPERVLIDPNSWSKDGADALAELSVSSDGKWIAYAVQEGGGDKRTFRVLDVDKGRTLADKVEWARFTTIEWLKDGSGFFYSRFPATAAFQSLANNHSIYFHKVGTPQSEDRLVHATPDEPKTAHYPGITDDGRYLTVVSDNGSIQPMMSIVDLQSKDWKVRHIAGDYKSSWFYVGNVGSKFYISTSKGAERFKLVSMDIAAADPVAVDVVPEQDATLKSGKLIGDTLLLTYLVDVKSEIRRFTLDGKPAGAVPLPGMGVVGEISGSQNDPETFFEFSSFNIPKTIYRYDTAANTVSAWASPKVKADLDKIVVEQRFYHSKDGTRVPMFVVRRKDVTGPAPTILYGYGGYTLIFPPEFSEEKLAWVEQGGVYAVAHIRGGGEYGEAWHDAGRLYKKQNVFDDFIAAGEYLKAQRITPAKGLAIQGESNGGMLIGAVVNQRPDLFEAALPMVGVQDMLRFHKFTNGIFWTTEYGSPDVEADFRNLYRYSPYHNIRSGAAYPAILAVTADTDDRVIPGHSFKYTAALQAADIGPKPHLVRIETRAGHGRGKPIDKIVDETADMWAFAARWTGLHIEPTN